LVELSIIIVNYKSEQLIANCLKTLFAETRTIKYEVIIVDNASGAESEQFITSLYPAIRWIQMGYNAGFARANNEGIRHSNAAIILLLNPDTLIENGAIENTFNDFKDSTYVAAGVQLLNTDRTPQISGNYFVKGGLNYLLPLPYLGNFIRWLGMTTGVKKPNVPEAKGIVTVDWINGAFLMVKKTAIERVGLMDEDFFLFAEETEWCGRLKKAGELCIFGDYHVIHLQGETANISFASSGKGYCNLSDRKGLQIMISNLLRIRKQFGSLWLLIIFLFYFVEMIIFPISLLIAKIISGKKTLFHWYQVSGYISNVFKVTRLLPKMIANQPYFYKVLD
jgi:GT2 family glycosyltransferase